MCPPLFIHWQTTVILSKWERYIIHYWETTNGNVLSVCFLSTLKKTLPKSARKFLTKKVPRWLISNTKKTFAPQSLIYLSPPPTLGENRLLPPEKENPTPLKSVQCGLLQGDNFFSHTTTCTSLSEFQCVRGFRSYGLARVLISMFLWLVPVHHAGAKGYRMLQQQCALACQCLLPGLKSLSILLNLQVMLLLHKINKIIFKKTRQYIMVN